LGLAWVDKVGFRLGLGWVGFNSGCFKLGCVGSGFGFSFGLAWGVFSLGWFWVGCRLVGLGVGWV